ncbi:uncharacterized protein LOC100891758 [Strongylocentrotus purpuratus]|uniref:Death domain-containing protein n=1 Tax=Strongylocentrotus purpuratus TaxID=7668 RepID=A0A7M7NE39_STRPU|nr:uncharacterized protein LOC100891758 [Strongylocentrotus purpuratus]
MAAKALSKVLQDDMLIKQLAESIDSVKHYFPLALGRDLLGSQAAVSDIIGWTERDYRYQNIVSECLKTWRNANGKAAGTKLVEIFRGLELDKVATYLEQELKRRPNCLIEDTFLQSLASQLDCTLVYRKLGLPLLENNDMKFNDLIRLSNIQTTQHHKDLLHVLHAWIIQVGKSRESLEELKKILLKHGLKDTAQQLHFMEYGPNAGPMDIPRGTEEMETVGLSSTPLPQKVFYDIYLLSSSKKTSYFLKMKNLIQRNEWKMTSPFDSKLGEPVLKSIEKDLSNCSHVVYLITEEDCVKENVDITMTIEIALKSVTHKGLGGRVIPVFCCDISIVPPLLSRLTGENIDDEALEGRLSRSIDVDIRKKREKEYRSVSGKIAERLQGASSSQPQQAPLLSTVETLEIVLDRQEDFDEKLKAVARSVIRDADIDYLGRALGFDPAEIHRYIHANMRSESYMGTLSMLRDWRKMQTKATEFNALKYVLERAGQIRLADELFELVQGASSSQPQQASHQNTVKTLENNSVRQEDFDDKLITVARKVARRDEIDNLGKALGFEPEDIQHYVNTNFRNSEVSYMGTLLMLRDWSKKQTKATVREALKDVLIKAGRIRLAFQLFGTS